VTDLKQKLLKLQRWLCTPSMSIYAEGNSGKIRLIIDGYLEAIEALEQYNTGAAFVYDRSIRGEVHFNHSISTAVAREALAKAAERLGKL
jgi:hypothetical protein